ncbi:MAG TPA: serine hydrolase domain-containing protein [Caulobacteraceae bacterium]|jgi:CubicO group peptidase (beta-lactamase class C family)
MTIEIEGLSPERFAKVRDAFAGHFAAGEELGARFTVCEDGEVVLDLQAGWADRAKTRPFAEDTLVPVWSLTKAVTATMLAWAVERGKLDYEQTVASLWPEFAQAGKGAITVGQALSHQAGLAGFPHEVDARIWFDWAAVVAEIEAMAPMWEPGTASGYAPNLFGFVAGEIFRRADGRSIGRALAEDFAGPFGLDLWIGLPASEDARVAEVRKPAGLADFGEHNAPTKAAFLSPWSSARGTDEEWRRMESPGVNGIVTAEAVARLMGMLANGGELGGRRVLSPETIAAASRERIRGRDLVLPFELSWAAGFQRSEPNMIYGPNPDAFGHAGWGGSCAFADPARRLSAAYTTNRQSTSLIGDPRALRLIEALYASV